MFADTNRLETTLTNLFESEAGPVALQFHYRWTLRSGRVVEFDCVGVFALNAERTRFAGLTKMRGASSAGRYMTAGAFIGLGIFTAVSGGRGAK